MKSVTDILNMKNEFTLLGLKWLRESVAEPLVVAMATATGRLWEVAVQLKTYAESKAWVYTYKKAVLPQGNRAMPQVFFLVEVRQQHSLQV